MLNCFLLTARFAAIRQFHLLKENLDINLKINMNGHPKGTGVNIHPWKSINNATHQAHKGMHNNFKPLFSLSMKGS